MTNQRHLAPACKEFESSPRRITWTGGGTGMHTVLSGLRLRPEPLDLAAVVAVTDDGGNNETIRDEYGGLPPSDFRQAMIALAHHSDDEENPGEISVHLREFFEFRFPESENGNGPLKGFTGGNVVILFLRKMLEAQGLSGHAAEIEALKSAARLLRVRGTIIPVSLDDVRLRAKYANGEDILGEHLIDEPRDGHDVTARIVELSTEPAATLYPDAEAALINSHLNGFGPADLYTSTLCNIVVGGFKEALCASRAPILFVVNLMTKKGQTLGMTAKDHVEEFTRYAGRAPDHVIVNNGLFPQDVLDVYAKEGEYPVVDDLGRGSSIIRGDFISRGYFRKPSGDILRRSLARHSRSRLAAAIVGLLQ